MLILKIKRDMIWKEIYPKLKKGTCNCYTCICCLVVHLTFGFGRKFTPKAKEREFVIAIHILFTRLLSDLGGNLPQKLNSLKCVIVICVVCIYLSF